jgi:hypothetical protein
MVIGGGCVPNDDDKDVLVGLLLFLRMFLDAEDRLDESTSRDLVEF